MLNILYSLNITHSLLIYLFEELCLLENNLFKYENKRKKVIREKKEKKKTETNHLCKRTKDYYLCNKTTSIGVNRVVEFKCIFFVIYTASSDYQEHFVDSSYQVSIPHSHSHVTGMTLIANISITINNNNFILVNGSCDLASKPALRELILCIC